jgi:hypothetical protein
MEVRVVVILCVVGFEVLTAVSTKMAVFCVVAPCSLVEVYQFYQTTLRYNPEDSHLHSVCGLSIG